MKNIYVAAAAFGLALNAQSQTVLLSEDFQGDLSYIQISYPAGGTTDASWYNWNDDLNTDASGGSRPEEWFLIYPFAVADSVTSGGDTNIVLGSNSWVSGDDFITKNHLITASIDIPAAATSATLRFKSAPRQTPLYLDGFRVFLSNTNNDLTSFTTTLFTAKEFDGPGNMGGDWSAYTFAPAGAGFVHGWDGTNQVNAQLEYDADSARWIGVLTEQTISLAAYAGQTIFIDFYHVSEDDNLLSIDDIVVEVLLGDKEITNTLSKLNAYPNPTTDLINFEFTSESASPAIMTVTDVYGRIVGTQSLGMVNQGSNKVNFDASALAFGTYNVQIRTDKGTTNTSFVKN